MNRVEGYFTLAVLGYLCLTTFEQLWAVQTLAADESQIFIWGHDLAWGYGPQPPLYSWLQWLVFQVTGPSQFGVVVLRKLLTTLLLVNSYFLVRQFRDAKTSALSVAGLFLVYEVSWLFLQDRTHNILVTALAPLVCLLFIGILGKRNVASYVLFGLVTGLSVLAKPSGIFLPLALCVAALASPTYRFSVLSRKSLISILALIAVLTGPTLWALNNQIIVLSSTGKFSGDGWPQGLADYAVGMAELFALPVVLILVSVMATKKTVGLVPEERLLFLTFGILALTIVPIIIFANIGNIHGRWLLPAFIPAVPLCVAWVLSRQGVFRWLPSAFGALMVLVSFVLYPSHMKRLEHRGTDTYLEYATILKNHPNRVIVGPHKTLGNVALLAPDLVIRDIANAIITDCSQKILLFGHGDPQLDLNRFQRRQKFCDVVDTSVDTYVVGDGTIWVTQVMLGDRQ